VPSGVEQPAMKFDREPREPLGLSPGSAPGSTFRRLQRTGSTPPRRSQRDAGDEELDVHKETVVACARVQEGTRVSRDVATFARQRPGCSGSRTGWPRAGAPAWREAIGVYWEPVWHVLEGRCELMLANAAAVRNVPGRKSDVTDAVWLADLLAHGLIRREFCPARADPSAARSYPHPQAARPPGGAAHTAHSEDARGCQSQDHGHRHRSPWTEWPGDPPCADCRRDRRGAAPRPHDRPAAGAAGAIARGAPRCGYPTPPVLAPAALEQIEALERAIAQLAARVADLIAPFASRLRG
jgi:hypothetical protein